MYDWLLRSIGGNFVLGSLVDPVVLGHVLNKHFKARPDLLPYIGLCGGHL